MSLVWLVQPDYRLTSRCLQNHFFLALTCLFSEHPLQSSAAASPPASCLLPLFVANSSRAMQAPLVKPSSDRDLEVIGIDRLRCSQVDGPRAFRFNRVISLGSYMGQHLMD